MHEPLNTMGGRFGFVAVYPGGRRIAEDQATWDEVPRDEALVSLDFVNLSTGDLFFSLHRQDEFFFANEAVSDSGGPRLVGKVFGGWTRGEGATVVRVDLSGEQPRAKPSHVAGHPFAPHAVRPGVRF